MRHGLLATGGREQVDRGGRILTVAVGADLVGEHLADGRAADGHLDVPRPAALEAVDDRLHVRHRRRQERAHADDRRLALVGRGHELLDALVDADVVHFEPGAFSHHAHEVLADVVQVAANGAHQQHADVPRRLAFACAQERLEHGHAGLHRARRNQDLGNVEHVVLEVLADDTHAGNEAIGQDLLHRAAFSQGVAASSARPPWPCPRRGTGSSTRSQASRVVSTPSESCNRKPFILIFYRLLSTSRTNRRRASAGTVPSHPGCKDR